MSCFNNNYCNNGCNNNENINRTTIIRGLTGATGPTGPTGPTGEAGETPTLTIGTVITGEPGTDASATITGTAPNYILNLTIPRGNTGASANE